LPDELRKEGITTRIIPYRKTYDIRAAKRIADFIRGERFDVLHSHAMLTNVICRPAGHWASVPVSVSTQHVPTALLQGSRGRGLFQRLRGLYYRLLDNYTSRFNQAVIAVSEAVKRDLLKQGIPESKVVTIRNGVGIPPPGSFAVSEARKKMGIGEDASVVGAAGRLSAQKDYPTLLRAAKEVLRSFPDARFLIAGEGPARDELVEMAGEMGLKERVEFLGYRNNIMEVISAFDIFALSSLWEGLPLVVLEAMALAKPVVATAVPGTAEAVAEGETGYLVPLGDHGALAGKIIKLLEDPSRARTMGRAGRRRAEEHFTLERMVDEHENLYLDLFSQSGR